MTNDQWISSLVIGHWGLVLQLMYAFFDKFGKKILAVAAALLIVVFLLPPGAGRGGGGAGGAAGRLGTIGGGQTVSLADASAATARLRDLTVLVRAQSDPRMPGVEREVSLPELLFGPQLLGQFQQNPLQWYLLLTEARGAGVAVSDAELDEMLSDPTRYRKSRDELIPLSGNFNPNIREQLKAELRDLMAVRLYVERGVGSIKISQPLINDHLARNQQQVQLRVSVIEAGAFVGEVQSVSEEELRLQFDAFASNPAGNYDPDRNPFGFGYRIPDRIRIQYIAVPRAEVERAVIASKDESLWEEEAIMYHTQHPGEFQTPVAKPTGDKPATQPTTLPTTRPYAEARGDVLTAIRGPLIEQKELAVLNRMNQQLAADHQKAIAPPAAGKPAPTTQQAEAARTPYGVAYGSFEYLQKLADDVQRQFGVKVAVVSQPGLLSADQIREMKDIGMAFIDEPSQQMTMPRGAAEYLIESTRPLLSGAALTRSGLLDLLQPSRALRGMDGTMYVARVVEAEQSHAPRTLEEVKADVEKDVRKKLVFAKAVDAGQKVLDAAKVAGDLQNAPGAGVVQTTGFFDGGGVADIGLKDADAWSYKLVEPAFKLLRDVKSTSQLPVFSLVKLQRDDKVIVAQLMDVKTLLSVSKQSMEHLQAESEVARSLMRGVSFEQWFSLDAVSRRLSFKPEHPKDQKPGDEKEPEQPRPMNPFAP